MNWFVFGIKLVTALASLGLFGFKVAVPVTQLHVASMQAAASGMAAPVPDFSFYLPLILNGGLSLAMVMAVIFPGQFTTTLLSVAKQLQSHLQPTAQISVAELQAMTLDKKAQIEHLLKIGTQDLQGLEALSVQMVSRVKDSLDKLPHAVMEKPPNGKTPKKAETLAVVADTPNE